MNENDVVIKILVDNKAEDGLLKEHGFSAWIEAYGRKILFDTGQGNALAKNSEFLKCDLSLADILILSHGHYDHTGGMAYVLKQNPDIKIFCHPKIGTIRYSIREGANPKDISMPEEIRSVFFGLSAGQIKQIDKPESISGNIGLSGFIPRKDPLEDTGGPFFLDPAGKQPDIIEDDMALWINSDNGLIIITGCCHSGLINTIEYILKISGQKKIHAVIGGFHLANASALRLEATCEALQKWNAEQIIACHCTGDEAAAFLRKKIGTKVIQGYAGMEWNNE
ncbi:MAG: MBL fold metallo-hydrolase [Bacteroidetes bacterium]|nr:MBL fold metallo-hydrolase [Bacteroidota bacterium]